MIVEELVSKLGIEIDGGAIAAIARFRNSISTGLNGITGVVGAAAAALAAVVGTAASAADNVGDAASRLGVSAQALQELGFAAQQSESSLETVQSGLKFLSIAASQAASGSAEMQRAFAGIALKGPNGQIRDTTALLADVADKVKGLGAADGLALSQRLFGRGNGEELVPLLRRGSAGLGELAKKANELGVVFSPEDLRLGGEIDDQLKLLSATFQGLRNIVGAKFFGALNTALAAVSRAVAGLRPIVDGVATRFAIVGDRLSPIANAIAKAFDAVGIGKLLQGDRAIAALTAGLLGLTAAGAFFAVQGLVAAGAWLLAAAPFILLALVIGAALDEVIAFASGGESYLGDFANAVQHARDTAGPLGQAFFAVLDVMRVVTDPTRWVEFGDAVAGAWPAIADGLVAAMSSAAEAIYNVLSDAVGRVFNGPGVQGILSALTSPVGRSVAGALTGGLSGAASGIADVGSAVLGLQSPSPGAATTNAQKSLRQVNTINISAVAMDAQEIARHVSTALTDQYNTAADGIAL
jgi:hypothetical protein